MLQQMDQEPILYSLTHQSQMDNLLAAIDDQYFQIKASYSNSIKTRMFDTTIQIVLKNILENLRSQLDYTAWYVLDQYNLNQTYKGFPIVKASLDPNQTRNRVRVSINPGTNLMCNLHDSHKKFKPKNITKKCRSCSLIGISDRLKIELKLEFRFNTPWISLFI
jgi:hypothetical protein